ncbi:MAG: glycoside hydrolase family 27 protein [Planctomycetia bacterium]|nr:glycoside hydrolase family 27 protein [Planctomycetia bacterium]
MGELQYWQYQRRDLIKFMASAAMTAALGATPDNSSIHAVIPSTNDYPKIASGDPPMPEFHGPKVIGTTPGRDFIFRVPYTGQEPMEISAVGLPDGLAMNRSGIITGTVKRRGAYKIHLKATNSLGSTHRTLRIVAGDHKLAMTPLMGWEAWNAYGTTNNADRTHQAAEALIQSGLAAKGYNYIIVDEGAQRGRNAAGELRVPESFGGLKALTNLIDYVHSQGLRYGTYSSPGPKTCAGNTGSFGHVLQDARTYAQWGVDYLKYDWCSYAGKVPKHPDLEQFIKPYREMRGALDQIDRDIAYSLCQYGMAHVWTWGGEPPVWGNTYRVSGDINDSWAAIYNNGFRCNGNLFPFAGPGHWNDPDMLVVGYGWFEDGPMGTMHPTRLTPHEQLTHITLWCMLAAPLLLGCDLTKLDQFTKDLVSNTEVIAVDQDELGVQAQRVDRQGSVEVWARPLWDGTIAIAIFNLALTPENVVIPSWRMLDPVLPRGANGLRGNQPVRNLWRRQSLGVKQAFHSQIPAHSAIMLKVGSPNMLGD